MWFIRRPARWFAGRGGGATAPERRIFLFFIKKFDFPTPFLVLYPILPSKFTNKQHTVLDLHQKKYNLPSFLCSFSTSCLCCLVRLDLMLWLWIVLCLWFVLLQVYLCNFSIVFWLCRKLWVVCVFFSCCAFVLLLEVTVLPFYGCLVLGFDSLWNGLWKIMCWWFCWLKNLLLALCDSGFLSYWLFVRFFFLSLTCLLQVYL